MIHLIWIIPGYIAAGFLLAIIAKSEPDDAPWIILCWPLFIALCVLAGIIEGIRRVYIKMEDKHYDNR
jgi:hypothetical protein